MAEMSTTYISTLPTGAAGGSKYLVQDDGNNTTKVTVNDAVASATAITSANSSISSINTKIGSTALPTTAQTLTGAIAELNSKFTSYLPNDTNIDNWNTTGFWVYQRESPYSHTGTYPISDQYGTLICVRGTSANFAMQMIRSNSTSRTDGTLYIRYRTAGTWGSWLTFDESSKLSGEVTLSSVSCASGSFVTVGTFTPPVAGNYIITCTLSYQDATSGIRINLMDATATSTNTAANSVLGSGRCVLQKTRMFHLDTSNTIYFRGYQNSGSTISIDGSYRYMRIG